MKGIGIYFMLMAVLLFKGLLHAAPADSIVKAVPQFSKYSGSRQRMVSDSNVQQINETPSYVELEKQIVAGKKHSTTGVTLWASGLVLQITGMKKGTVVF